MENKEYNRLIYENKFEELANTWNISDLTTYKYINKYLLEYLLVRNIHTNRMDSHAINNKLWINLYIKYNIIKPLVNVPLDRLFEKEKNRYLLDILLEKMSISEKIQLYQNIKYTSVWLFRNKETKILNIFKKYGVAFPRTFLELPKIKEDNSKVGKRLDKLLYIFNQVYDDVNQHILDIYTSELKRYAQIDYRRTCFDITRLIDYKLNNPKFKLQLNDLDIFSGSYDSSNNSINIDQYIHGILKHELSHFFFEKYEEEDNEDIYKEYCKIRKEIVKKSTINKIVKYLKSFHEQVDYMKDIFTELYYKEIIKQYGSVDCYILKMYLEIMNIKPEKMIIDEDITELYIDYDDVGRSIKELLASECKDFVNICVTNYYREEFSLENLLDAILRGRINEGDLIDKCYSGHTKGYFNNDRLLSIDECLADYDTIKCSRKADYIIDKLIELVGIDLVKLLDNYLERERGSKKKVLKHN